ncbi:iron-sulfur cluster carrier protein ApbC [Dongshaea marina]|uniref:iron-sulfur cluster carrier protein ApbC n=1 Tax=Dongshaea marina TaxID=2047966 RepID=UPI001F2F5B72|nr:iron-sulfur cluster carrier protein ApbC [Dongshaea marina]
MNNLEGLEQQIRAQLSNFKPDGWESSLTEAGFLKAIDLSDDKLVVKIRLPFAGQGYLQLLMQDFGNSLRELSGVSEIEFAITTDVATIKRAMELPGIRNVRNIIAVSSGKGGVGKSTTAVNLALALSHEGARVGLLDADIYGPSIPLMLGTRDQKPVSPDGKMMLPIDSFGIVSNSIGYMVPEEQAAIWRGPMASKALSQLLYDTAWPELDYLVIDMPPGTGDIQLTLAQQVPTTAAVVITTPQDIALADARKGIAMFRKMNIPVLGVVENMSYYICSQCGRHDALFGSGGGESLVQECQSQLLGELPLHRTVREDGDAGTPSVAHQKDPLLTKPYFELARKTAAVLYFTGEVIPNEISIAQL